MKIPFNIPTVIEENLKFGDKIFDSGSFSGNNKFSLLCAKLIEKKTSGLKAYMTNSCSSALEMAAILLELKPGDEVIVPSFSFPSTAGAFRKQNARIVWCDIDADSKNIAAEKLEALISPRTKCIVAVHYGGVSCKMDLICDLCKKYGLFLIEDCAHSIGSFRSDRSLGNFGDLAVFSFHETKNIQCGEGGALLVNNKDLEERATILYNRGTDRERFQKNEVDHYSWVDFSNNFMMSEIQAVFLYDQLKKLEEITRQRVSTWNMYYDQLSAFIPQNRLPVKKDYLRHNGHLFYILTEDEVERTRLIAHLKNVGIGSAFHYQPLHLAPVWKGKYTNVSLPVTIRVVKRLLRLPIFHDICREEIDLVVNEIRKF